MTDAQIAAAAGEHFVAYKIATLGFVPALVRQRVPGVDLLVSSPDGARSVGLHVKSSTSAVRETEPAQPESSFQLRFPLGQRVMSGVGDKTIFCFVDLRRWNPGDGPDVYVVPALDLKKEYDGVQIRKYAQFQHHRPVTAMERYRNNWQPVKDALRIASHPTDSRKRTEHVAREQAPSRDSRPLLLVDHMVAGRQMLQDAMADRP